MRVAFITVGDPARLTGGYLYHAEVFARLRARGLMIEQIIASPVGREEQAAATVGFGQAFEPASYDIVVVDALARTVCAPHLDTWRATRPVVGMVHELPSVAGNGEHDTADEAALLRSDRLIAVSEHGASILRGRGVPPERISIASPGRDRVQARHVERTSPALPVALCVAQWIPRKGITTLVEAWAQRQHRSARLELIGETDADPAYAARVRAALAHANDPSIRVRGTVDDTALASAYRTADMFVLPSRYEGFGMVYAEALSYHLPIVACRIGPVPELVGEAGLLVAPDDTIALRDALDTLLRDPERRQQLALLARARVAALSTWDDTADDFEAVLRSVTLSQSRT